MEINNKWHPTNGWRFLYIRNAYGDPIGLIASHRDGKMGWSLCHRNLDTFTKTEAKIQATNPERLREIPSLAPLAASNTPMNRALLALSEDMTVPHTIRRGARVALQERNAMASENYGKPSLLGRIASWFGF